MKASVNLASAKIIRATSWGEEEGEEKWVGKMGRRVAGLRKVEWK